MIIDRRLNNAPVSQGARVEGEGALEADAVPAVLRQVGRDPQRAAGGALQLAGLGLGGLGHVDVPGAARVDPVDHLSLAVARHLQTAGGRVQT